MYTSFYISENRIGDLELFIRTALKTARFKSNPFKVGSEYHISLDLCVEDYNKLSIARQQWNDEDTPKTEKQISVFEKLKSIFK